MPRFYDDYGCCFLTHDSAAGRKQQRRGWKFRDNFKRYYSTYVNNWRGSEDGLAVSQQNYFRKTGATPPPLPDGWKEEIDEVSGIAYFINLETNDRTWARPGFVPPANPQMARGPVQPMMGVPPRGMVPPYGGGPPRGFQPPPHMVQAGPPRGNPNFPPPHMMQQPPMPPAPGQFAPPGGQPPAFAPPGQQPPAFAPPGAAPPQFAPPPN